MSTTTPDARSFADYGRQFAPIYDHIFPRGSLSLQEVAWLIEQLPSGAGIVVELGVGTGRIALPLQTSLKARNPNARFIGVDVSEDMIKQLVAADGEGVIETRVADITTLHYDIEPDVVICVCGTISMLCDTELQQTAIRRAAAALKPGGKLIIETHHASAVSAMHVYDSITYCVPYPGNQRALVSFSTLKGNQWHVDHAWLDNGTATFASEDSRLTTLDELDSYAANCGLERIGHTQGFSNDSVSATSPTVTAVYTKPA